MMSEKHWSKHWKCCLVMQQDVVRVQVSVDDGLRQEVEVVDALGDVEGDPQLGQDVHGAALLMQKAAVLKGCSVKRPILILLKGCIVKGPTLILLKGCNVKKLQC
jgi:hypothetical protein